MKNKLSTLLVCLLQLCYFPSFAKEPIMSLFVGNSLTYSNNMPKTLQKMLMERHEQITIDFLTIPAMTLAGYLNRSATNTKEKIYSYENSAAVKKIMSNRWDNVILQEATIGLLIHENRKCATEPAIRVLDSVIRSNNGKTILFQSFATQEYFPKAFCYIGTVIDLMALNSYPPHEPLETYFSDTFLNASAEFNALKKMFAEIGEKIGAPVAPVGEAFESAKKAFPDIMLYESETDSHPSEAGSYLIACVFYRFLTGGNKVTGINYRPPGVTKTAIKNLQKVADEMAIP